MRGPEEAGRAWASNWLLPEPGGTNTGDAAAAT